MDATENPRTPPYLPTTGAIRAAFEEEVAALGGTVHDAYDDGERLFLRAVLPRVVEVLRDDAVRGGVAVRTHGAEILVHPYTLRQVCTNGAIHAQAIETRRVERPLRADDVLVAAPSFEAVRALAELREAVRACAAPRVLARGAAEMRSAAEAEADHALTMMSMLASLTGLDERSAQHFRRMILARFEAGADRSAFGLMNAVTSVARDTAEPDARWRLEALGGGVPARLLPRRPKAAPAAALLGA